jgi:hypothetical protein
LGHKSCGPACALGRSGSVTVTVGVTVTVTPATKPDIAVYCDTGFVTRRIRLIIRVRSFLAIINGGKQEETTGPSKICSKQQLATLKQMFDLLYRPWATDWFLVAIYPNCRFRSMVKYVASFV